MTFVSKTIRTVIHLEDDPDYAFMMKTLLCKLKGVDVITISPIEDVLVRVREIQPDLIITDLLMVDNLTSIGICDQLKSQADLQQIQVAIISAFDLYNQREAAQQAGCDLYIVKVFNPREIRQQVKAMLGL